MNFQLLIRAFIASIILVLAITAYFLHSQNVVLRTASDRYKKDIEQKIAQTEKEYEQDKSDIDSRYNSVINRLRKQKYDNVRTPTTPQTCEGERDTKAAGMYSELLRRYAEVSRYADQLRVTAEKCEKIN